MAIDLRPYQARVERRAARAAAKVVASSTSAPAAIAVIRPKRKRMNVPSNIKQYVKSQIASSSETKEAQPVTADDVAILPYGQQTPHTFTTLNLNQIFQGIPNGTLNGQRIGNEIKARRLTFKGFINWDSSRIAQEDYTHIPLYVKMFVFRRKTDLDNPATYSGLLGVGEDDILMNGSTPAPPTNKLSDFNKPFNTEVYKIYKVRTFKLGPAAVGNTPTTSGQWNNDFKFSQRFSIDLSKHINKIKYQDGNVAFQTNVAFYVGFLVAFANNSPIGPLNKPPVEIHYTVNMNYEDA